MMRQESELALAEQNPALATASQFNMMSQVTEKEGTSRF